MTPNSATSLVYHAMQDGIASGASKLAESGLPGLAIVVLASAVVWLTLKLMSTQNTRIDDAKLNTKDMLSLSKESNQVVTKVEQGLDRVNDTLERVEEALKRNEEVLRRVEERLGRRP